MMTGLTCKITKTMQNDNEQVQKQDQINQTLGTLVVVYFLLKLGLLFLTDWVFRDFRYRSWFDFPGALIVFSSLIYIAIVFWIYRKYDGSLKQFVVMHLVMNVLYIPLWFAIGPTLNGYWQYLNVIILAFETLASFVVEWFLILCLVVGTKRRGVIAVICAVLMIIVMLVAWGFNYDHLEPVGCAFRMIVYEDREPVDSREIIIQNGEFYELADGLEFTVSQTGYRLSDNVYLPICLTQFSTEARFVIPATWMDWSYNVSELRFDRGESRHFILEDAYDFDLKFVDFVLED